MAVPVTEAVVERLLVQRYDPPEVECEALEAVALALAGSADGPTRAWAIEHLNTCAECAGAVEQLGGLSAFGEGNVGGAIPLRRAWYRRPMTAVLAAAALVLLVLGIGLLPDTAPHDPDRGLTLKGPEDLLAVAVQRGDRRFTAQPGDRLLPGDRIGLFYTAAADGYLLVLHLDEQGQRTLLFPAGGTRSGRISAGAAVPLPDGGVVEDGSGCEFLIAVFSEQPLAAAELNRQLAAAERSGPGCRLRVDLPDARTVHVFPVPR